MTLSSIYTHEKAEKNNTEGPASSCYRPCLEFWFLLHFEKTAKQFNNCSGVETQLKKHIKHYAKTQKFFTNQNNDIYMKLKPNLKTALENSEALGNFDTENPKKALCEMALLFWSEELEKYFNP